MHFSIFDIISLILLPFLITFAYASFRAAPWLCAREKDVKRSLSMAKIKPGQKAYDLGSGDGRVIFAFAEAGALAEGFEISLLPYLLSLFYIYILKKGNGCAKVRFRDFWNQNLSDADFVYFWLTPPIMTKLKLKFEKELKKGTKVICYYWPIEGWSPVLVDSINGAYPLYLYEV